jgi:uncharacterized membrane protein YgcG
MTTSLAREQVSEGSRLKQCVYVCSVIPLPPLLSRFCLRFLFSRQKDKSPTQGSAKRTRKRALGGGVSSGESDDSGGGAQ